MTSALMATGAAKTPVRRIMFIEIIPITGAQMRRASFSRRVERITGSLRLGPAGFPAAKAAGPQVAYPVGSVLIGIVIIATAAASTR